MILTKINRRKKQQQQYMNYLIMLLFKEICHNFW